MHLLTGLLLGEMFLGGTFLRRGRAAGAPFELVHVLPGRVRVRVATLRGNPALGQRFLSELAAVPGVVRTQTDIRTGSVLVCFEEKPEVRKALIELLQRLSAPADHPELKRFRPEVPLLRQRLQDLGSQANGFVMQQSHGVSDLTTLLGVSAGSWGIKTLLAPGTVSRWQGMTLMYWGYNILRR